MSGTTAELPLLPRKQRKWHSPHGEAWADAMVQYCRPGTMQAEILRLSASTFDLFGRGYPTAGTIADWAIKSERGVRRTLKQLVQEGLILLRKEGRRVWIIACHWFIGDPADRRLPRVPRSTFADSRSPKPDSESAEDYRDDHTEEDTCTTNIFEINQNQTVRGCGENRDFREAAHRPPQAADPAPKGWESEGPAGEPPEGPPFDPDFDPGDLPECQFDPGPLFDVPGQATSPRRAQAPDPAPEPRPARRQAPPPPARHGPQQASDDLIRPTPEAMREVWNEAVKDTPIPRVLGMTDKRYRRARQVMREACRDHLETWEDLCRWIAGDPFHRGERNGQGHENWVATFDYVLQPGRMLELVEKLVAKRRAYDAECEAAGVFNAAATMPEPLGKPVLDKQDTDRMAATLPVLTRKQILEIDPTQIETLKTTHELPDPVAEAQACAWVVRIMAEFGLLPKDLVGGGRTGGRA